jgi:hypothetical protein
MGHKGSKLVLRSFKEAKKNSPRTPDLFLSNRSSPPAGVQLFNELLNSPRDVATIPPVSNSRTPDLFLSNRSSSPTPTIPDVFLSNRSSLSAPDDDLKKLLEALNSVEGASTLPNIFIGISVFAKDSIKTGILDLSGEFILRSRRIKHTFSSSVEKKLPNINPDDAKIAKDV